MKTYTPPQLTDIGDVRTLTAADQTSMQTDSILDSGNQIGESTGSLDACVSPAKPPRPGDLCK
ncbi:lasso RiPP family leader peptide-containing protein [Rubrivirga sp. S365]|uniref:Lasso RiPP family leader peptide-containing protein n=1 Tax=Rubrivirga litoralis TaxID=3075598 RepID=A0ABU3BSV4_9BACT|nr:MULTISPECIES: lasso RiPP family leader peptide-containing protein [unclassified Rubrivirga]MDT0632315.1 lasso RiPP family leader peptide-containing protein [Rubrivirga sp. F394]MDT7856300.1 lasso RiPP family leader peptide-containing protein [Rubrivirga sp. S365]